MFEVPGPAVENLVGAESTGVVEASFRGCADHVCTAKTGKLRSQVTDASGGSVDEHTLTLLEPAPLEKALPGAERSERDRSAGHVVDRRGFRRQHIRGHCDVVSGGAVAVEGRQRIDRFADRHRANVRGDGGDDARELVGGDGRETVHGPVELVARYRRCMHPDERLSRIRTWRLDPLRYQPLRSGRTQSDRFHQHEAIHALRLTFSPGRYLRASSSRAV
ncbi:MAG TPA: hypothetical protein VFR13_02460 [Jiangellaceae bacterium]|nr:hypothetical protein [Jiangellaceae bacterium]